MDKVKIFLGNFISALLAQSWIFGMFLSITKQLSTERVLQILPLALIVASIYGLVQMLGHIFITNKTALRFLFLIPAFSVCFVGFAVAEESMLFYACGGALMLSGYGAIMREKKLERMSKANGN